jgi:hypothetical protein
LNNIKLFIDNYIQQHKDISASIICEFLIKNHGVSEKKFSTGRPKVYVEVVTYLERLFTKGILEVIERNQDDCKYEVITGAIELSPKVKETKVDITEIKDTEEQMSLF